MRKIWLIIKREYLTRVKTKAFVISTLIVPLLGIGTVLLIAFLVSHTPPQNLHLVIVDEAGGLALPVKQNLEAALANGQHQFTVTDAIDRPPSPDAVEQGLRSRINSGALGAYLVIPGDLTQPVELHTKNPGNFTLLEPLTAALNEAVIGARLNARGIHVEDVHDISRGVHLQVIKVSQSGESVERGQTIAITFVVLLYMSLLMYGIITMRSVLEEKTTRTRENQGRHGVVLNDPTSTAAVVLSEIPFFAPVLMPLRISLQMPPVPQIILSLLLLVAAILGTIWASAKVYRVGVLMYGKRPTLPELLRWLRYS
jgi:ABC-type Na+ efflux pump permease subunit